MTRGVACLELPERLQDPRRESITGLDILLRTDCAGGVFSNLIIAPGGGGES